MVNPVDGAEMVLVPAGEFRMGLTAGQAQAYCARTGTDPSNVQIMRPQRTIYLDAFWIYKKPVTYGQFRRFCQANKKYDVPNNTMSQGSGMEDLVMDDSYPVVRVSFATVSAYCKWAKVQLPTEAQWEKAARGTDARLYPWGDEWDDGLANFDHRTDGSIAAPCPVDDYPEGVSPYGALQMSGNVQEWCSDRFAPYGLDEAPFKNILEYWQYHRTAELVDNTGAPLRNPEGPSRGMGRVIRGGGWANGNPDWAGLVCFRKSESERNHGRDLGLRPVWIPS